MIRNNAVHYLISDKPEYQTNAMIVVDSGKLCPMPFERMMDPKTKKTTVRYVDIESESYKVARSYMVRLEKIDLEDQELLSDMAKTAKLSEKEFKEKFGYLVDFGSV
jgi:hypothetical protein